MNHLFLLKLIAELLSSDKPTADEIGVAKKIIKEMIEEQTIKPTTEIITGNLIDKSNVYLDSSALQAKRELTQ